MSETTPRLTLPLIQGGQTQKHLTLNAGLMRLESLVQAQALSRSVTAQPATPDDGDSYILPDGATGLAWSGLAEGAFVRAESGIWEVVAFPAGAIVHVADEDGFVVRLALGWVVFETAIRALRDLAGLGVNAVPDSYNVLAVRGAAALMSAAYAGEGGSGDLSLALNKESDGDTVQLLLQKDYSTRAILGLLGDNDLAVKMSADGASFVAVLTLTATGAIKAGSTQVIDDGGRLCLRSYTVAGLPTSGLSAGTLAYASNGRMVTASGTLEGAGAGTGGVVCWNGSAWKLAGSSQTVAA